MQPNTDQWGQPIQPDPQQMLVGAPQPMVVGGVEPVMIAGRPAQMMGFVDSVKSAMMNNFANFDGRASRSEYWWFYLFFVIMQNILGIIAGVAGVPALSMAMILLVPAGLSSAVRRMHDHGKSGWFILIPLYNLYLMIIDGEAGANAHGAPPTNQLE